MQDLNRCTEIQYPLLGHFFIFSTTAVKRKSTFQGILVLLSFNTSNVTKSHRANRCYTDAFIVQDLNRCTEIQYTLLGHFVPQLWRDSLLFNGCSNYFHSIHQTYRSHNGATGVIAMLSLCRTWIEVLKFSLHLWGTSSVSEPQLWRDSLLFKGL